MGNRRRRRNGLSRRRVLAGSFITAGGALMLSDAGAFSQLAATRGATIGTSIDENALLGLDIVDVAPVGVDGDLVDVSNNTDGQLETTLSLADRRDGESIDPTQTTLQQAESERFVSSLDADRATDRDAVDITVTGSGTGSGSGLDIELSRTIPVPSFSWQVYDNSRYGNVQFELSYTIGNVPDPAVDIEIVNRNSGTSASYERSSASGSVTYPREGREGGAGGDEYEITFDIADGTGRAVLHKVVTIIGGESGGEGDPGSEGDPQLDWVFVDDFSHSWDGTAYTVYYQVSNLENFEEVQVTFDHESDWATGSTVTSQAPVGVVEHDDGNYGDAFDIVARVKTESGATVDSTTVSDTADGTNPNNPDTSEPDSPTFASLDVADDSANGGAEYVVTYAIDDPDDRFGEVRARFENLSGNDQTNETIANDSGTITYSTGYTAGDEYRITVRVFEDRAGVLIPVETEVYTDVADGQDP